LSASVGFPVWKPRRRSLIFRLAGKEELDGFRVEGRPDPVEVSLIQTADFRVITPDYFRAMRIPLLKGRFFTEQDRATTAYSAIIDDSFARRFFPGEDPLGKRIDEDGSRNAHGFAVIVGVVGGVKHTDVKGEGRPTMYVPANRVLETMTLVVRSSGDPAALASALREQGKAVDNDQPLSEIATMQQLFSKAVAPQRFNLMLVVSSQRLPLRWLHVGVYGGDCLSQ
jgi:hypothetical protein